MEHIWRWAYAIWHGLQEDEISFRFVLWLRERGVTFVVKRWLVHWRDAKLRKHPNDEMKNSRVFYEQNQERIKQMLSLLSDEKSKAVMGGGNCLPDRPGLAEA